MSTVRFLGPYDHRVAAELPEGYVVGTCAGDCVFAQGAVLEGVARSVGEQQWSDGRSVMTVKVEDFDLDSEGLRNWSTGVE
ncbi:hypothetical protein [Dyella jiangningensis]|uniref:Uncharacterized protein n=1 Tax=Dyella jiangningensis TaxID=1379159 RepID=A0A328P4A1_9GAMM|nr:hypothetical protein [Dyella jiangningensis]RAO76143.1 hypothetical protein CA260_12545 [Dyella jiangningensis]